MRPNDKCPECGCGFDRAADPKYGTWGGWDGYCGHFDCGACSLLRKAKDDIDKLYARQEQE